MLASLMKSPATYEDLVALPEYVVGEIIDGELWASPRPAPKHARASTALGSELFGPFDRGVGGPGGWWILDEPELHLGGDVLVPDLAGWRRERMPRLPDEAHFTLAPDWICEVLSPGTAKLDLRRKLPKYARMGVRHAWVVDPLNRTVEPFRRDGETWTLVPFDPEGPAKIEPFAEVGLDLEALWVTGP